MNKEAPFGTDSFCDNDNIIIIKESAPIGASLFILTVLLRDIVISRSAPIGADFDIRESLITVVNEEAPIGADLNMTLSLITE